MCLKKGKQQTLKRKAKLSCMNIESRSCSAGILTATRSSASSYSDLLFPPRVGKLMLSPGRPLKNVNRNAAKVFSSGCDIEASFSSANRASPNVAG